MKLKEISNISKDLSAQLTSDLHSGRELLFNFAGGSNIDFTVKLLVQVIEQVPQLHLLHLAPLDDRWDLDPHYAKSNWQALRLKFKELKGIELEESGFSLHPMLTGKDLNTSAVEFTAVIESLLQRKPRMYNLLGIGADGHFAGIMLHNQGNLFDQEGEIGYLVNSETVDMKNPQLDATIAARITPGFPLAQKLVDAGETVIVASGSSKLAVLQKLLGKEKLARESFPAVVLREGIESGRIKVYTDSENIKALEA